MHAASHALRSLQEASASASEAVARMDAFAAAAEKAAPAHQALAAAEEAVRASMKCMELDGKAGVAVDPGADSCVGQYVDALGPAEDALKQVRASAEKARAAADAMLGDLDGLGVEASRAAGEEAGKGVLSWKDKDEKVRVEEFLYDKVSDQLFVECEQRGYEWGLMASSSGAAEDGGAEIGDQLSCADLGETCSDVGEELGEKEGAKLGWEAGFRVGGYVGGEIGRRAGAKYGKETGGEVAYCFSEDWRLDSNSDYKGAG